MQTHELELVSFLEFTAKHLESDLPKVSPEQLVRQWRSDREFNETVADIRQGFIDLEAGRVTPAEDVLLRIRRKLGLAS